MEDIEKIKRKIDILETKRKINQKTREEVEECLKKGDGLNTKELDKETFRILGWLQQDYVNKNNIDRCHIPFIVLKNLTNNEKFKVKPNKKLKELCAIFVEFFIRKKSNNKSANYIYCFNQTTTYENRICCITIQQEKCFFSRKNRFIRYTPIEVDNRELYRNIKQKIEKLEKEELEILQKHNTIFLQEVEIPKDVEKYICRDIEEGSYKIQRFSKVHFRGKDKIYLHLDLLQEDKLQGEEKIVTGYYIEEEWKKIEETFRISNIP